MIQRVRPIWKVWIDTGGTFTDCLARDPAGNLYRAKVLSSSALRGTVTKKLNERTLQVSVSWSVPDNFVQGFKFRILNLQHDPITVSRHDAAAKVLQLEEPFQDNIASQAAFEVRSPEEAPLLAARLVTRTPMGKKLPDLVMRLATTRGTNALLERSGVRVALFITRGFGDLLLIGNQQRPDIFALDIRKPEPLYERVVEVNERMTADGSILHSLDLRGLLADANELSRSGIESAAVVLMHSFRNPEHEIQLESFLRENGFSHISRSSDLAPFIKIVARAQTTVVDAYLAPIIQDYLDRVRASVGHARLEVMTSSGGLVHADDFRAKDGLLSGPAGGVVGAALVGQQSGYDKIIAFDMGGTSTDASRFDGDYEYVFEHEVGAAHLVAPALAIESVAAGGGSICRYDGFRLRVGPESASADPGPACYGAGGPLTLTDVNLLLGYLQPDRFEIPIKPEAARARLNQICTEIQQRTGEMPNEADLLRGFLDIANERMADAIRRVSVSKGYDQREYALVAFGGAGGQHACGVATRLDINTIIIPNDASLLSAYGLGHALIERFAEKQVLQQLEDISDELPELLAGLARQAMDAVAAEGVARDHIEVRRQIVNARFLGQDSTLALEIQPDESVSERFMGQYQNVYGHVPEGRGIEVESIRVVCSTLSEDATGCLNNFDRYQPKPFMSPRVSLTAELPEIPAYERSQLRAGAMFTGPCLVLERHCTTLVEAEWSAFVDGHYALILKKRTFQQTAL